MAARGSLIVRAVIAVALMILFYATALAAIAGLGYAGLVIFGYLGEAGGAVLMVVVAGAACWAAAGVIAWSVAPRLDRFEAPGPEVTAREQPALFDQLRRLAAATGEDLPAHVYLVDDVNAFVAARGGLMGFGSRRVMGIGLPLLRAISVKELRAVLAHELGHFYGGDTRLGPWIYKTRGGVARTVANLSRAQARGAVVHALVSSLFWIVRAPFLGFAKIYLRISQAVSRAQELSADRVAVRVEGAAALVGGLKKTHAAALAHALYLRNEVAPLVERGALPPVGEGFSRFLRDERIDTILDDAVDTELRQGAAQPYDSHPSLRERIAAAHAAPGDAGDDDARPAIELVTDPERYETAPIAARISQPLRRVSWAETGRYWIEGWRDTVGEGRAELAKLTVATVPHAGGALRVLAQTTTREDLDGVDDAAVRRWAAGALGSAIAVVLVDAGYDVVSDPGAPFRFVKDGVTVEPFTELAALFEGRLAIDAWRARFAALGLADASLATS